MGITPFAGFVESLGPPAIQQMGLSQNRGPPHNTTLPPVLLSGQPPPQQKKSKLLSIADTNDQKGGKHPIDWPRIPVTGKMLPGGVKV